MNDRFWSEFWYNSSQKNCIRLDCIQKFVSLHLLLTRLIAMILPTGLHSEIHQSMIWSYQSIFLLINDPSITIDSTKETIITKRPIPSVTTVTFNKISESHIVSIFSESNLTEITFSEFFNRGGGNIVD